MADASCPRRLGEGIVVGAAAGVFLGVFDTFMYSRSTGIYPWLLKCASNIRIRGYVEPLFSFTK